jgi:hypothetical protein
MDFKRKSKTSSIYTTNSNIRSGPDVYSEVSGVGAWQNDGAAQELTSPSALHDSQLIQFTHGHTIHAEPDKHGKSASVDDSLATRVLQALIRRDDQSSTLLLAKLRFGLSVEEVAAQISHSADGGENLELQGFLSGHGMNYENLGPSIPLTSTDTKGDSDSQISLPAWLMSSFDRSYWQRHRHDKSKRNMAVLMRQADYGGDCITFARTWNHHFGNLDFTSAIDANNYSLAQQELQKGNFSAPKWAVRLMNYHEVYDPLSQAIEDISQDCKNDSEAEAFCGPHAYVEALTREDVFNKAPKLSQHLARLIKGIKVDDPGPSGLQYALMVAWWSLIKWLLSPSKESYEDIPVFLRPGPWQYFVLHAHIVDFVMPVRHREYLCKTPDADMSWVTEGCRVIECDWPSDITFFERDPRSGEIAMSAECKVSPLVHQQRSTDRMTYAYLACRLMFCRSRTFQWDHRCEHICPAPTISTAYVIKPHVQRYRTQHAKCCPLSE